MEMKKLSSIFVCLVIALLFASCQTSVREDKNGNTPSSVVEKMYQALQNNKYEQAAEFCKIPEEVDNIQKYDAAKQGKAWKDIVILKMEEQSKISGYSLKKFEIVSEEISNTDPNSAKVKTKIYYSTSKGEEEAECSFPLKRENDIWLIIG